MSLMDRIKALFGGSAAEGQDHAHDHSHDGHDHGHDHSHDEVAAMPAAPVDPQGTSMPEATPGPMDADEDAS
jgi:hypothetical protein